MIYFWIIYLCRTTSLSTIKRIFYRAFVPSKNIQTSKWQNEWFGRSHSLTDVYCIEHELNGFPSRFNDEREHLIEMNYWTFPRCFRWPRKWPERRKRVFGIRLKRIPRRNIGWKYDSGRTRTIQWGKSLKKKPSQKTRPSSTKFGRVPCSLWSHKRDRSNEQIKKKKN